MKFFAKEDLKIFAQNHLHCLVPRCPILLSGPLGAGKSTLGRFFIEGFLGESDMGIPSPSFPIMIPYTKKNTPAKEEPKTLWHMDLYRIKTQEELISLDLSFFLENFPVIVEWPENLGIFMPDRYVHWTLEFSSQEDKRLLKEMKTQNYL